MKCFKCDTEVGPFKKMGGFILCESCDDLITKRSSSAAPSENKPPVLDINASPSVNEIEKKEPVFGPLSIGAPIFIIGFAFILASGNARDGFPGLAVIGIVALLSFPVSVLGIAIALYSLHRNEKYWLLGIIGFILNMSIFMMLTSLL